MLKKFLITAIASFIIVFGLSSGSVASIPTKSYSPPVQAKPVPVVNRTLSPEAQRVYQSRTAVQVDKQPDNQGDSSDEFMLGFFNFLLWGIIWIIPLVLIYWIYQEKK